MSSSELETSKLNGEGGEGAPRSPNPEARGSSDSKSCWEFHCKSDIDRGESELDVTFLVTPSPASLSGFFCLGTQPSQFIEVLNTRVLRPYQHVMYENKIDYATWRNI